MSLAIAVLVAALSALVGVEARTYLCWLSWLGWRAKLGIAVYVGVGGLGGGLLLGWLAARAMGGGPTSSTLVNGVVYGLVGAAALRVESGVSKAEPVKARTEMQLISSGGTTLLRQIARWLFTALDELTKKAVEDHYRGMDTDSLLREADFIRSEIQSQTGGAKEEFLKLLVKAMENVRKNDAGSRNTQLIPFCAVHTCSNRCLKPKITLDLRRAHPHEGGHL